ncbi:MAG: hypothetical protein JW751_26645 [Polyangiaceae bacterium]|nr:hypothetical protein [Polyangiaceae bacterium]
MGEPSQAAVGGAAGTVPAGPPAPWRRLSAALRWWPTVLFVLLGLGVVLWVGRSLFVTQLATYNPRSDFWEHSGVLRALMDNPLHPRNPHLDSDDASSRYMPLFVGVAIVARMLQLDAFQAMALAGTINVSLLVVGVYAFFLTYFRDPRAPLYGLIVVLGSWYRGFKFSNVYQLVMLFEIAGYPSTACIAFSFITFAIAVRVLRGKASPWWMTLLTLSTTNAVLTHPLTATMTVTGVICMAWFEAEVSWRRRWLVIGLAAASSGLVELWPYFSIWRTFLGGEDLDTSWIVDGLEDIAAGDLQAKQHLFYSLFPLLRTIGFAVIGIHALSCFLYAGRHRFVVAGAAVMLLPFVANSFMKLPLGHRFILLVIPYLQIATVWLLLRATPGYSEGWWVLRGGLWRKVLSSLCVAGMLGAMVYVNVSLAWRADHRKRDERRNRVALCRAVATAVRPGGVVLGDPSTTWPLPTCGVKVVALLHQNPLAQDQRERGRRVREFLRSGTSSRRRRAILAQYRVSHVITHAKTPASVRSFLGDRGAKRRLPSGYTLYTLKR